MGFASYERQARTQVWPSMMPKRAPSGSLKVLCLIAISNFGSDRSFACDLTALPRPAPDSPAAQALRMIGLDQVVKGTSSGRWEVERERDGRET